ncbi:hypothetical protein POVWA2_024590 [Plasmodium ovale wallikeri]|uniref:Uncharacterized protein n=1 Tax=Plasmodium ovale wallikeri TaxID=864142 RepID=A0A1A8YUZ0_PLAOA|nr:hypothetical protein POVWA2_024590 [Plasmodium ovale wallikeri]
MNTPYQSKSNALPVFGIGWGSKTEITHIRYKKKKKKKKTNKLRKSTQLLNNNMGKWCGTYTNLFFFFYVHDIHVDLLPIWPPSST